MKIYVMRHGKAGIASTDPDEERYRGLTPEGREGIRAIARDMLKRDDVPTVILTSGYSRTMETANIMGRILGIPVDAMDELGPHYAVDAVFDDVLENDRAKRVLIIGHCDNLDPWLEENALNKGEGDGLDEGEIRKLAVDRDSCEFEEKWRLCPEDVYDPDDEDEDDPRGVTATY